MRLFGWVLYNARKQERLDAAERAEAADWLQSLQVPFRDGEPAESWSLTEADLYGMSPTRARPFNPEPVSGKEDRSNR